MLSSDEIRERIAELKKQHDYWTAYIETWGSLENLESKIKSYEWLLNG